MHVLRDCKLASEIWNHLLPAHRQPSFFNLPVKDWISVNLDKANQREENWATTFATTLWWLWKWRNKRCFENPDFNQPQTWDFIRTRAKEIATAFNTSTPLYKAVGEQRKQDAFVRWHTPGEGWIKLNVDGASKGNPGLSGGGGIFRDHYGNWLKALACNFGWCTCVKAEILALLKGLRTAWAIGYRKVEVNMYSQITVRKTQQPCQPNQPLYFIKKECRELLARSAWETKISHYDREANQVADYFANLGVSQNNPFVIFDSPPNVVVSLLSKDVAGVSWPRRLCIE